MNTLTAILKRHIWCVIIIAAILLLAAITLAFGDDVNLISHLSLASAVVSIVLAVIVIVYMYYQDYRSSQNITEMRRLIDQASRAITDKADLLAGSAELIDQHLSELTQPSRADSEPAMPPLEIQEPLKFDISVYSRAGLLMLYSLAKSYKLRKPMSWEAISGLLYEEREDWAFQVRMHGFGIIQSFQAFLGSEYLTSHDGQVEIKKLPEGFTRSVIAEIDKRLENALPDNRDTTWLKDGPGKIDDYFDNL